MRCLVRFSQNYSTTMPNSENIQQAADQKRSEAKRKLSNLFRIPYGYASNKITELIDDIIDAAILENAAIQAKASESNADHPPEEAK